MEELQRRAGRRAGVLGSAVLGAIGCLVAAWAPAWAQPAPAQAVAALEQSLQRLREHAEYGAALDVARRIEAHLGQDASATDLQRADARTRTRGLERIARLPDAAQRELAEADRLSARLDVGFAGGDYAAVREGARRQLDIRRRHLGDQHPDVATSLAYLGVAQQATGDFAAAEQSYRELLPILHALSGDEHPDVATILGNLATVVQERGDWLQAEALYRQVLALQRRTLGAGSPELARSLNNLATLLQRQGDAAGAEPLLRESLDACRRTFGFDSLEAAFAASNLAEVLQARAELEPERTPALLDEAETLCQASLAARRRALPPEHPDVAAALYDLAEVLQNSRKHALAEVELREALRLRRAALGADHPDVAQALAALGALLAARGEWRPAAQSYEQALAIDRAAYGNLHWRVVEDLAALGRLHLQRGDTRRALPLLTEACDAWDAARARAGSGMKLATARVSAPYATYAAALLRDAQGALAWQAAERGQGRLLAGLLAAAEQRSLHPAQSAREDSLRRVLADRESQMAALREAHAAPAQLEQARQQLLEAEAAWSALQSEKSSTTAGASVPLPLERVQACLRDDEALIGWVEGPSEAGGPGRRAAPESAAVWGYVVRHGGPVWWVQLPPRAGAPGADPIAELRSELAGGGAAALGVVDTPRARELRAAVGKAWVAPLLGLARRHGPLVRVVVVPSGRMSGVPVEALMEDAERPLLDQCAVVYAPSATALTRLRESARAAGKAPPGAAGTPPDSARASLVAGDPPAGDLPGLQWSALEARRVAAALPRARLLMGGEASEAGFAELAARGELGQFATLHLATHAVVDDVSPEHSCLVLARTPAADPLAAIVQGQRFTDGRLTAREIVQTWRLQADLVTLSACETGLGRRAEGEGYLGLAYALFQVGARGVLVSLWRVDDEATALLMERFYQLRRGNARQMALPTAEALREAKRQLRDHQDAAGHHPFAHPYYWGGFVLVGDGDPVTSAGP